MKPLGLFKAKYILLSDSSIKYLDVYLQPETLYGEVVIYDATNPVYSFSLLTPECGDSLDEINRYIDKYKLDAFLFIDNILKETTSLRIKPSATGILFCLKITKEVKMFDLKFLNIDKYWNGLTPNQIKEIRRKSKRCFSNM